MFQNLFNSSLGDHKNTLGCCNSYLNIILRGKNFEEKSDKKKFYVKKPYFLRRKIFFSQFERKNGTNKIGLKIGLTGLS